MNILIIDYFAGPGAEILQKIITDSINCNKVEIAGWFIDFENTVLEEGTRRAAQTMGIKLTGGDPEYIGSLLEDGGIEEFDVFISLMPNEHLLQEMLSMYPLPRKKIILYKQPEPDNAGWAKIIADLEVWACTALPLELSGIKTH